MSKPKLSDLKEALKGYLSGSLSSRIEALVKVMMWYDTAVDYVNDKKLMTPDGLKYLSWAGKARENGISTKNPNERETSFLTAITQLEKVVSALQPISVKDYVKLYNERKKELEAAQKAVEAQYETVLDVIKGAFKSSGMKVSIDPKATVDRFWSGTDEILYSRNAIKEISFRLKNEGMLPALTREMMLFSRAMAAESDGQGSMFVKPEKQVKAMSTLLNDFVEFARKDDTRFKVVRVGVVPQNTPTANVAPKSAPIQQPTAPKSAVPRAPRAKSGGITLIDELKNLLKSHGPMHYKDLTKKLTHNKLGGLTPELSVNRTLTTHPEVFKKAGKGIYSV